MDPRVKQIKIKTGVVSRLVKEKLGYEKEAAQLEAKVEKLKAEATDEYVVKKQCEVLQESRSMIPDTVRRLKVGYNDLDELLNKEADLAETEEYIKAKEALETASPHIA